MWISTTSTCLIQHSRGKRRMKCMTRPEATCQRNWRLPEQPHEPHVAKRIWPCRVEPAARKSTLCSCNRRCQTRVDPTWESNQKSNISKTDCVAVCADSGKSEEKRKIERQVLTQKSAKRLLTENKRDSARPLRAPTRIAPRTRTKTPECFGNLLG